MLSDFRQLGTAWPSGSEEVPCV